MYKTKMNHKFYKTVFLFLDLEDQANPCLKFSWNGMHFYLFHLILSYRILNILNVIAPAKHFQKMKDFVSLKLPPGFPVKIGEPLFAFLNILILIV